MVSENCNIGEKKSSTIQQSVFEEKSNQDKLNKWDYIIAVSSGAMTAAMDILWVKDINLFEARVWEEKR